MHFEFENLEVWKRAMSFSFSLYEVSQGFPNEEKFGLTSQLRRAATSIALNIAEGAGRHHKPDFIRFARIARGSLNETVTLLHMCFRLGYMTKEQHRSLYIESNHIGCMLNGLCRSLKG